MEGEQKTNQTTARAFIHSRTHARTAEKDGEQKMKSGTQQRSMHFNPVMAILKSKLRIAICISSVVLIRV